MKNIITAAMKEERFALEVKATYTYQIFINGNDEISILVQRTKEFEAASLDNQNLCTMSIETFDRMSLDDVNWIVYYLRTAVKNEIEFVTCEVDDAGNMTTTEVFENITGHLEKHFELAAKEEEHEDMKKKEVLDKLNNFLAFVKNNELMDTERKIDQGYGFSQGLISVFDEYFDDIAEITQNWICSFYNTATEPDTEQEEETAAEQEEQPEEEQEEEKPEIIETDVMTNIYGEKAEISEWSDSIFTVKFSDDSVTYTFENWDRATTFCEKYGYRF